MSIQDLKTRLIPLFEAHKQTLQLINRLAKLPAQPGSSAPTADSSDARIELGAEIHQSLKEQEESFELLRQEVEDQTTSVNWASSSRRRNSERERDRTDLATQITRLGENLKIARSQFRKAQLQAKRNAEAAKRKEREILFTGVQEGNGSAGNIRRKGQEKLSQDEILLNASSDVTVALRRTHALMQTELTKSQFAQETLEESTAALSTLSESYNNLDTLLSSSRTLVSSLLRSQKSDTWYLESAFWLLVVTICWLIFRRILYGPGWWLLYLPVNLTWRLLIFNTQVILSFLSTVAGSVGGTRQSSAVSQASERTSRSLIVKPSATGGFPTFQPNMPAPSVAVGAGGSGAKAKQPGHASPKPGKSLSDQVGEMAESTEIATASADEASKTTAALASDAPGQSHHQGTVLEERSSDEPPNPKKRMWEERPSEPTESSRSKDEL